MSKGNKTFAHLGHVCTMVAQEDVVTHAIPGDTCCTKLSRFVMRSILPNEHICKKFTIHLRSHGAIEREQRRQLIYHPTSIHPCSSARVFWEFVIVLISAAQLILVPLDVGLYTLEQTMPVFSSPTFLSIRMALDVICCLDIGVSAITGYYEERVKEIVLNHHKILLKCLKGRFAVDFITSIPTHLDFVTHAYPSSVVYLQGLSLLKYIRYWHFYKYSTKLCKLFDVNYFVRHSLLTIISVLMFWNVISCTLIYIIVVTDDQISLNVYKNLSASKALVRGFYDGALIISAASYGVVRPETDASIMINTLLWFVSKIMQILFLGQIIQFLRSKDSANKKYSQILQQLKEYMRYKKLPIQTQKRILIYYETNFQKTFFDKNQIFSTLSCNLVQEIEMQNCRHMVANVEFFQCLPIASQMRIVSCLKNEIFLTDDLVIKANTPGKCMYFILSGTVAVYTASGKEVCHLEDGEYFGEIALIRDDGQRVASVVAVEICELYRLDRKDFVKATLAYPDLLESIQKIAADRTERTAIAEARLSRAGQQGSSSYLGGL